MCGRARITRSSVATMRRICNDSNTNVSNIYETEATGVSNSVDYNIENSSPGMECPVIVYDHISHRFIVTGMIWGLVPSYQRLNSNDRPDHFKMFNKRIEKLDSAYFSNLVKGDKKSTVHRNHRCLVVFDGFYEWKSSLGKKQPYYISGNEPFLIPAIWDSIKINGLEELRSFAILTCNSSEFLASEIHNRQPVILSESQMNTWLNPNASPFDISNLLVEIAGNAANPDFKLHPVTKEMTNPKYQQDDCSKPIKLDVIIPIDSVFKRESLHNEKSLEKRTLKEDVSFQENPETLSKKRKKTTMMDYFKK